MSFDTFKKKYLSETTTTDKTASTSSGFDDFRKKYNLQPSAQPVSKEKARKNIAGAMSTPTLNLVHDASILSAQKQAQEIANKPLVAPKEQERDSIFSKILGTAKDVAVGALDKYNELQQKNEKSAFAMRQMLYGGGSDPMKKDPITGEFTNNAINAYKNAKTDEERAQIMAEDAKKIPLLRALNSDVGKKITAQISDKTSDIPLKTYARLIAIGDKTYEEAYKQTKEGWSDPNNPYILRLLNDAQNSGFQSLIGVGIALSASAVTRSPTVGNAMSGAYFGAISAEEERGKYEGGNINRASSIGNIAIDTVGDTILGNVAENILKNATKDSAESFLKTLAKGFIVEGVTEPTQSLLKYTNDYTSSRTDADKQAVVDSFKDYIRTGGMLNEFLVGGIAGASITGLAQGAGTVVNYVSTKSGTPVPEDKLDILKKKETPSVEKAVEDGKVEEVVKKIAQTHDLTEEGARTVVGEIVQDKSIDDIVKKNLKKVQEESQSIKAAMDAVEAKLKGTAGSKDAQGATKDTKTTNAPEAQVTPATEVKKTVEVDKKQQNKPEKQDSSKGLSKMSDTELDTERLRLVNESLTRDLTEEENTRLSLIVSNIDSRKQEVTIPKPTVAEKTAIETAQKEVAPKATAPKTEYKRYEITVDGVKMYADLKLRGMSGASHIEWKSLNEKDGNPISETGYKSDFVIGGQKLLKGKSKNEIEKMLSERASALVSENKPKKKSSATKEPTKTVAVEAAKELARRAKATTINSFPDELRNLTSDIGSTVLSITNLKEGDPGYESGARHRFSVLLDSKKGERSKKADIYFTEMPSRDEVIEAIREEKEQTTPKFKTKRTSEQIFENNRNRALTYLERAKARFGIDFNTYMFDNIMFPDTYNPMTGKWKYKDAYGAMQDNTIMLAKDMTKWTPHHEFGHLVFANLENIDAFRNAGISRGNLVIAYATEKGMPIPTRSTKEGRDAYDNIEEEIMLNFEDYLQNKYKPKGLIARFFEILKRELRKIGFIVEKTQGSIIKDFYDILDEYDGHYDQLDTLVQNNALEGILDAWEGTVLDFAELDRVIPEEIYREQTRRIQTQRGKVYDAFRGMHPEDMSVVARFIKGLQNDAISPDVQLDFDRVAGYYDIDIPINPTTGKIAKKRAIEWLSMMIELQQEETYMHDMDMVSKRFKIKDENNPKKRDTKRTFNEVSDELGQKEKEVKKWGTNIAKGIRGGGEIAQDQPAQETAKEYLDVALELATIRKSIDKLHADIEKVGELGADTTQLQEIERQLELRHALLMQMVPTVKKYADKVPNVVVQEPGTNAKQNKAGVSRFQERNLDKLPEANRKSLEYDVQKNIEEMAKAQEYYEKNKKRTTAMALDQEPMPDDVNPNAIRITALKNAMEENTDPVLITKLWNRTSKKGTEAGQYISLFQNAFGENDTATYLKEIADARKELLRNKWRPVFKSMEQAPKVEEIVERVVKRTRKRMQKPLEKILEVKASEIDSFLEEWKC